jgi:hypothetical protein
MLMLVLQLVQLCFQLLLHLSPLLLEVPARLYCSAGAQQNR